MASPLWCNGYYYDCSRHFCGWRSPIGKNVGAHTRHLCDPIFERSKSIWRDGEGRRMTGACASGRCTRCAASTVGALPSDKCIDSELPQFHLCVLYNMYEWTHYCTVCVCFTKMLWTILVNVCVCVLNNFTGIRAFCLVAYQSPALSVLSTLENRIIYRRCDDVNTIFRYCYSLEVCVTRVASRRTL